MTAESKFICFEVLIMGEPGWHSCPSLIPGLGVIWGLSLLLVLALVPKDFSPGTLIFRFPPQKIIIFKFKFDRESVPIL